MVEVIWVFGIILFGLLTISYGASIRGKTCAWKEGRQFWTDRKKMEQKHNGN